LPEWAELGEHARFAPGALQFRGKGDVRKRPEYAEGRFVVQEEGAQLAALALGATPGHKVLDACAGHGQKASLLADVLGGHGELWLTDLHQKKLEQLQREFFRLGLAPPSCLQVDWSRGPVGDAALRLPRGFDRILVDAPCSGTGTLRRRPEIALRLKPSDAQRLAAVSESILRQAAGYLSPAGRLLFVVCSVLERECEAVVERVGDVLRPLALEAPGLVPIEHGATSLRLLPHEHGTDGFFIACLGRR
jgi:16S rRNA (cytosine967-C5)-methyltransferase